MRRILGPLCVLLVIACLLAAATGVGGQGFGVGETKNPAPRPALTVLEDTPVKLRLEQTLSSGTSKLNDKVDFTVMEDVKIDDTVVIAQGDSAIATVTTASPKKSLGRAGKLLVNIDYVRLTDGSKCALRSVKGGSGGNHTAAITTAVVVSAIVYFPAAPLFLFIKGKNVIIPKGTEITAYVAADTPYGPERPGSGVGGWGTGTEKAEVGPGLASVTVRSTPVGAEIEVDDKFVGTTPSVLKLAPGDHTFRIKKAGFPDWTRTVNLSPGSSISLEAALQGQ